LLSNGGEAIPVEISNSLRKASVIGGESEVGSLVDNQLLGVVKAQDPVAGEDIRRGGIEPFHQETAQIRWHGGIDSEIDNVATPAPLECRFVETDQILGLLFDFDLAVAQYAKDALGNHRETREQVVKEQANHLLNRQKTDPPARQACETIDRG